MAYKVQRNLVNVKVEPIQNTIIFNFEGKINNDRFLVRLSEELIKDPQSVWINDKQTTKYELKKLNGVTTLEIMLNDSVQQIKVVGTDVIGEITPKKHILINQMFGITDKKFYEKGEEIVVSGEIKNPVQLYQISLDIVSPQGFGVYHKEIPLVDTTKFTEIVPIEGILREFGEYTVKITGPSAKSLFLSFEYGIGPKLYDSPSKQMKSLILPENVICNDGFELLMKKSNEKAVCVTESTAMILLQRGWADYF